jgi:purine-binding chemotaxis protein CheW
MRAGRRTQRGRIDWQDVRARLARATAATEEALRLSPQRAKAVLEERARALARAPAQAPAAGEVLEVATFTLADERYGLETAHVREVVRLTDYTPVPGAPGFLAGVVNLRGDILAVFDLRPFLGVAGGGVTGLSRAIVLGGARAEFGVLADAVHEVTAVPAGELHEPPASATGAGWQYLRGVTPDALIVLDGAALLQDGRLFIDLAEDTEV